MRAGGAYFCELARASAPASVTDDSGQVEATHFLQNNGAEDYVQIELTVAALRRLIQQSELVVSELSCLNVKSKKVVLQALLLAINGRRRPKPPSS
jgi:hypothetical protein